MDFEEIKQLVSQTKDRIILVENGKPVIVVMSFEDYKSLNNLSNVSKKESKHQVSEDNSEKKELTVDDLPF